MIDPPVVGMPLPEDIKHGYGESKHTADHAEITEDINSTLS